MPVAEKTSNRPAATKSSRTTLLSSFKRLSVQSRRTAHAVLGSVANTPYFFLEHFLSDGDYGRDRTIKARSRLLLIGNYPVYSTKYHMFGRACSNHESRLKIADLTT